MPHPNPPFSQKSVRKRTHFRTNLILFIQRHGKFMTLCFLSAGAGCHPQTAQAKKAKMAKFFFAIFALLALLHPLTNWLPTDH